MVLLALIAGSMITLLILVLSYMDSLQFPIEFKSNSSQTHVISQVSDADATLNLDHFSYNPVLFYFGFISLLDRKFFCLLLDHGFKKHYLTIILAITFMLSKVDEIYSTCDHVNHIHP